MNKLQFGMLKSQLPKDEELLNRLQTDFDEYGNENTKRRIIEQTLLRSMRLWVAKKVFFLIITFLIYGIYYFASHSDQHARNIFKSIAETRKKIRDLKEKTSEKNSNTTTLQKPKAFEYDDQKTDDELSYEGISITDHFKKAHPRKITFEHPIVFAHRFSGGNFLIQYQDLSTAIIDRCGNLITNLELDNTREITGVTVNDDAGFEPTYNPTLTGNITINLSDTTTLTVENATKPMVKIVNLSSPEFPAEAELSTHETGVYQIAISHDHKYLATADRGGVILLWNVNDFTPTRMMETEIYNCLTLFVSNEQEISVVCGEQEGYSPANPVRGRLLGNEIRFYNRPVPKPETEKEDSRVRGNDNESLGLTR